MLLQLLIFIFSISNAAPIGQFTEHRYHKITKPFVGTFFVRFNDGTESIGVVDIVDSKLAVRIARSGKVYGAGEIPLELLNGGASHRVDYYDYMGGKVQVTGQVRLASNEILFTETIESTYRRHVKTLRLNYDNGVLGFHLANRFYKKRFKFWGSWVADNNSFNAKHNSIRVDLSMSKRSSYAISYEDLLKVARTQPEVYYRVTEATTASEVRQSIENESSSLVRVDARDLHPKRESRGQIISFPSRMNCQRYFGR